MIQSSWAVLVRKFVCRAFIALCVLLIPVDTSSRAEQKAVPQLEGTPFGGLWEMHSPADGRFKILLPGKPDESTDEIETQFGKLERHNFTLRTAPANYRIAYSDLPANLTGTREIKQFLNSVRDLELARMKGRLLREREISLAGHYGQEFDVASSEGNFRLRSCLVERRLYQIGVSSPALSYLNEKDTTVPPYFTEESAERRKLLVKAFQGLLTNDFFNSFKLLPAAPQPGPRRDFSGVVLTGSATKKISPSYPRLAKLARVTGSVKVQVIISDQGRVIEAEVVSSPPLLWDAALNAAKQWEFKPTELEGVPVKVQGILTFNFSLQ